MPTDALDDAIQATVAAAKKAILATARDQPDRWWTAYHLKNRARNGWTGGTMDLALFELLDERALDEGRDLRLRARV